MNLLSLKTPLETLYDRYNHFSCIHPDPLEFVYQYTTARDREIVALIASSLAYGRVATILKSVTRALSPLGPSPADFIISHTIREFKELYQGFTHRFTTGAELADLLLAIQKIIRAYGSLKECFLAYDEPDTPTYRPALNGLTTSLRNAMGGASRSLLPDPAKGSAMKRLHLFLRWMIRHDAVDPGIWQGLSAKRLIVPLDTHLHAFGVRYGLTYRKQADLKTALEVTRAFRILSPEDPVKYDFALAHIGILREDFSSSASTLPESG